jgi:hypothetical protein
MSNEDQKQQTPQGCEASEFNALLVACGLVNERELEIIKGLAERTGTTVRGVLRQGARMYQNEMEPSEPLPPMGCMGD